MNGLIWVRASSISHIIAFGKIIQEADKSFSSYASSSLGSSQTSKGDEDVEMQGDENDKEDETEIKEDLDENGIERKKGEEMVKKRGVLDAKVVKNIVTPYL